MISGGPPFYLADPKNDDYYKWLCLNKHEAFWFL